MKMKKYSRNNYSGLLMNACSKPLFSSLYVLMLGLFLNSCDSFVEVDLPSDQLIANGVFEEKSTANAAMTEVYAKIRGAGLLTGSADGLSVALGNYSDELDFYGESYLGTLSYYNNSLTAANIDAKSLWDSSYNQIYSANAMIEGVEHSKTLSQEGKDQLQGEALFVRSLIHFYLANVFGAVPYVTTTDYKTNRNIARTAVAAIYAKAKADLETTIVLLPENYVVADRTRPNKYAAQALLARISLYEGSWDEASNAVSAVLNHTQLYAFESDLSKIFLNTSTTTIWQLSPENEGGNTYEGASFIFSGGRPPLSAISTRLMSGFESGDLRKAEWTKEVTNGSQTWYHPNKYKQKENTSTSMEFSIIFRTGELYLIRAEARARAGDLIGAKEDLNIIRNTAGLADTNALSQEEILQAILQERRIELFTEFGHRFFDLKRFGVINPVLSAVKPGWDSNDALFPIPETELSLNPNLEPQNSGY
jgi:hypothetical protein